MGDVVIGLMLTGVGAATIFAMYRNYDFIFESVNPGDRQFNLLVRILGRDRVRVLFGLLGLFIGALGMMGVLGIVQLVNPQ